MKKKGSRIYGEVVDFSSQGTCQEILAYVRKEFYNSTI